MSKYDSLIPNIKVLLSQGLSNRDITKQLIKKYPEKNIGYSSGCTEIGKITKGLKSIIDIDKDTKTNQYNTGNKEFLSAVNSDGTIMDLKTYCKVYGLNYTDYKSAKICTHQGGATYNLASKVFEDEDIITINEFKTLIKKSFKEFNTPLVVNTVKPLIKSEAVIKIADLHFGAFVENLIKTKNYSSSILISKLNKTVTQINNLKFKKVHIHILGDLIESFTGLNHINSFKSLNSAEIGANAIKGCTIILHNFLKQINNLGEVKIIAGNHDRVTSNNKEDIDGDAANLIAWALELKGYSIEFNPFIINHVVDDITHIITHGHHSISKKSTKDICWDYGNQNNFNLICEGHLHSIIERLSITQQTKYQTVKDDAIDHRRMSCPSFFTGNSFSERLGYTSNSGYVITFNNGNGIPNIWYMSV